MAYRLAEACAPTKLILTLYPVATVITDGSPARLVKVRISSERGVPVARSESLGDQLVKLELKDSKFGPPPSTNRVLKRRVARQNKAEFYPKRLPLGPLD